MAKALALALSLTLAAAAHAAEPANNFKALFAQINSCMSPLPLAPGTDVTILFSLNRQGGVIGKPRITHAQWGKDADPKKDAETIARSFGRCLPAAITDALGRAIAGRLFVYRLRGAKPETRT